MIATYKIFFSLNLDHKTNKENNQKILIGTWDTMLKHADEHLYTLTNAVGF